jgi:hypothetical protein
MAFLAGLRFIVVTGFYGHCLHLNSATSSITGAKVSLRLDDTCLDGQFTPLTFFH